MATFQAFTPTSHVRQESNFFRAGERLSIAGSRTTGTVAAGALRFCGPIVIPEACTLIEIGCEVTTLTDGNLRFGIWADDTTTPGQPGTLVLDTGAQAATGNINEVTISQAVSAGVYWLGVVPQGSTSDNTFRIINIGAQTQMRWPNSATNLNQSRQSFTQSGVTGAFAASATPVISNNTQCPIVYIERS